MAMCKKVNSNIAPVKLESVSTLSHSLSYPVNHCIVTFKDNTEDYYGYKINNIRLINR